MLAGLFRPKPLIDQDSADWLKRHFDWILDNIDPGFFHQHGQLVLPTNDFFPGRADSHQAMAQLLLTKTQEYAGLAHWPVQLLDPSQGVIEPPSQQIPRLPGQQHAYDTAVTAQYQPLQVTFNPAQVNDPQAMISSFAQTLAHALLQQQPLPEHLNEEQYPLLVELVTIYLGFGIPVANSAFVFAGGCGGCGKRAAQRQAFLSQDEALFGLALFCHQLQLDDNRVNPHLKPHLKKFYKRARFQLEQLLTAA